MKKLLLLLSVSLLASTLSAQSRETHERFQFDPSLEYDPAIPTPEEFLGYDLGQWMSLYADVTDYFAALASSSPKMTMHKYGETYEGRPLYYVVITSENNQQKIEPIRENNLKLSDPISYRDELDEIKTDQPVVVSYSYNIHGNEASSTEAAMQASYRLVAAMDQGTSVVLDNAVMVFFICINPDGRDRYAYWYNSVRREQTAVEPRDLDHYAPWPNGRTNHYWFDLNRDWVWGVHPESRGHTAVYQRWMPHVHVDYHEQGYDANYFTVPGTTPTNQWLPDDYVMWADTFGKANIAAFDRNDVAYFTRERFDFFYPSYGSSYPSVMGAIGMLTEQGGIGGGRAIETSDGTVLTLRQRIWDHYATSIATIKAAVRNREALIDYHIAAMDPANSKSNVGSYILPADNNYYLDELLHILNRNGVIVHKSTSDRSITNAFDYRTGKTTTVAIKEGDFVINTDQSRNTFINSILAPTLEIEDTVMYDMSTWSAILAYNLRGYSTTNSITSGVEQLDLSQLTKVPEGKVTGEGNYAYTIRWDQRGAPSALAWLWDKDYRVRCAEKPFNDGDDYFPEGSLIVLKGRNLERSEELISDIEEMARATGVVVKRHSTGRVFEGIDLASPDAKPVKQPRVALLVEPPFNTYTCGQIYFLFDQETKLPIDRVRTSILSQTALPKFGLRYGGADLNDYDVLILAGGGNDLGALFGEEQIEQLNEWVRSGGVLIATESAADFFTKEKSGLTEVEIHELPEDTTGNAHFVTYAGRENYEGRRGVPGASLSAQIDTTHPLGFGLDPQVHILKFGTKALKPSNTLESVGYFNNDASTLLTGGYVSRENLDHLAGQTCAAVMPVGQGKVVFLPENMHYRMFWRGPSRMMQNAVMLLPGF